MPRNEITAEGVSRRLLDSLESADRLISGEANTFLMDMICDDLSVVSNEWAYVSDVFAERSLSLSTLKEYDGLAGESWHDTARQWIERFVQNLAAKLDRNLIVGFGENGRLRASLLPPIFDDSELKQVRSDYSATTRLQAMLRAEVKAEPGSPPLTNKQRKEQRNDALLEQFNIKADTHPTHKDLAIWLQKQAGEGKPWQTVERTSIRDCLLEAWNRKHPEKHWPFDGRGRSGKADKKGKKGS
ncbi:hypothetical protein V7x_31580 [Crateriforma conspicua]|uniref:Uncharacterized protein n=1 Tax=Crateriforma conspicua TaxID=2527996 RepID=A0A5C6G315_9PLAN|nr:hypothetical protein [Crateriforma conspicua]TWU67583.1 hypothetical protein V7x_31580 [Crateriforma conspicua]